jgi:hypothetical protein
MEGSKKTVRELKAQAKGETRAREKAAQSAAAETLRADRAEKAQRDIAADRDRWRKRAEAAEAELSSLKGTGVR